MGCNETQERSVDSRSGAAVLGSRASGATDAIGGDLVAWMDPDRNLWAADLRTGQVARQLPADVAGVGIDGPASDWRRHRDRGGSRLRPPGDTAPRWAAAGDGLRTLGQVIHSDHVGSAAAEDIANLPPPGAVVFNMTGTKVYVSRGAGVRVLDTTSGAELANVSWTSPAAGSAEYIAPLQADDSLVVISDAEEAVLVDTNSPDPHTQPILLAHASKQWATFAATGGKTIAAVESDRVTVFDVSGDPALGPVTGGVVLGPLNLDLGRSWAVTMAPDGRTIAVAGETGVELVALDGSGLTQATAPVPADDVQALGVTDELMYSSKYTAEHFQGDRQLLAMQHALRCFQRHSTRSQRHRLPSGQRMDPDSHLRQRLQPHMEDLRPQRRTKRNRSLRHRVFVYVAG